MTPLPEHRRGGEAAPECSAEQQRLGWLIGVLPVVGVPGGWKPRPMQSRRKTLGAVLAILTLIVISPPAQAAGTAEFSARFTTTAAGSPTGLNFHVAFRASGDPNAKPPPLRSAVVNGPDGLRFDTGALPQCSASDGELQALGSDACPADTQLTVGTLTGITGFGPPIDPLTGDDHVFNGPSQLIEVITAPGTPLSPAFDRLRISGSTLTAHPPSVPGGPPDGKTSIRSIDFRVPVRIADGRSLITTPPVCPSDGQWSATATFYFDDGSVATSVSQSPCTPTARTQRPRLTMTVFPRRVQAGEPVRLRFDVSSATGRCLANAAVRVAGRSVRVDRHGVALLTIEFRRPGRVRARASSPGCRSATALLSVVAPRGRTRDADPAR